MFGKAEFVRTNKALTAFSAVAAIALALGGCDDIAAQHAVPVRPVLVTSVHYEAQAPRADLCRNRSPEDRKRYGISGSAGRYRNAWLKSVPWSTPGSRWPRSTRSISSCKPSRPTRNSARRPAYWRKRAPPKLAPKNSGRRAGRPTPNWTRRKRPPMRRALDSNAPNDRST